jgi:hypothetical protein
MEDPRLVALGLTTPQPQQQEQEQQPAQPAAPAVEERRSCRPAACADEAGPSVPARAASEDA